MNENELIARIIQAQIGTPDQGSIITEHMKEYFSRWPSYYPRLTDLEWYHLFLDFMGAIDRRKSQPSPEKKYFAKYLPVDGEVKDGDHALNNAGCVYLSLVGNDDTKAHQKMKLFLCSRDIQVGDKKVYSGINGIHEDDKDNEPEIIAEIKTEYQLQFIRAIAEAAQVIAFKVLCPISPEATWIKEGDEFTNEEWQYWNVDYGFMLGKKGGPFTEAPGIFVRIKGPCGHFH